MNIEGSRSSRAQHTSLVSEGMHGNLGSERLPNVMTRETAA